MNYRSSKLKVQSSKRIAELACVIVAEKWWEEIEVQVESEALVLREDSGSDAGRPLRDLLERTALFGERLVRFSKTIPRDPTNRRLIDQLVGAGTSVGANYCEANECVSKRDFKFIISRCMKEAKETKFFLRMVVASESQLCDEARPLYREAHELLCIFGAMRHRG